MTHEFADGQLSVVLGRNHAGKTRLARVLAGLDAPVAGRILVDGRDVTDQAPGPRSVALVYQAFVNYPNLTVAQNIASPLRAQGLPTQPRVTELARSLGLVDLLDRRPEQLSGGQQQRVAIARALAKSPRVLVLDEPLVNLDLKLREAFAIELRELLERSGATVLYNSSDPKEAFALGEQVLLLRDNELLQAGTPLELYLRPGSIQAAHLMSEPGVNPWREAGGTLAVRPEQLRLQRQASSDFEFAVHVLHVEKSGQETFLHLQHASGAHWVARLPGLHREIREDHPLTVFAPQSDVMRFVADGNAPNG